MRTFTEQDMIDFAEWLGYNCYFVIYDTWGMVGTNEKFTPSELLEIFINKDNQKTGENGEH